MFIMYPSNMLWSLMTSIRFKWPMSPSQYCHNTDKGSEYHWIHCRIMPYIMDYHMIATENCGDVLGPMMHIEFGIQKLTIVGLHIWVWIINMTNMNGKWQLWEERGGSLCWTLSHMCTAELVTTWKWAGHRGHGTPSFLSQTQAVWNTTTFLQV